MIDQQLIDTVNVYIENGELLNNYTSLIEQNADLHKELAKLKGLGK